MKMMFTLFTCLTLSGCMWQTTDVFDIDAGKQICEENKSKLYEITSYFDGMVWAHCTNGESYEVRELSEKLYLQSIEQKGNK